MRPFRFHPKANCFVEEPTSALSRCPVCFYAAASHSSIVNVLCTADASSRSRLHRRPFRARLLRLTQSCSLVKKQFLSVPKVAWRGSPRRETGRRSLDAGRLRCPSCSCSDARSRACVTPVCKVLGASFSRLRSRSTGSEAGKARILANPGNSSSADAFCDLRAVLVASVSRAVIAAAKMSMPQPRRRVKGHGARFRPVRPKVPLRVCYGKALYMCASGSRSLQRPTHGTVAYMPPTRRSQRLARLLSRRCVLRPFMAESRQGQAASEAPRPGRTPAHAR